MLTQEIKVKILKEILSNQNLLGKYIKHDNLLIFLEKIWDLKKMPSLDNRFSDAYGDIYQHIINNNDWEIDYLFEKRLNLINGEDTTFIKFIELVVHPTTRESKDDILEWVSKINRHLEETSHKLILTAYFENLPVYTYRDSKDFQDLPLDIMANRIPIYLSTSTAERNYPCFILLPDNWNDYSIKTLFNIIYYENNNHIETIGAVKIMKKSENITTSVLPDKFFSLPREYCSLGQSKEYYFNLRKVLGNTYTSFLLALRDTAMFPKIYDSFEKDNIFRTSLIRFDAADRLARTIRFEIENINPNDGYKFSYAHTLPYTEKEIILNFDFEYNTDYEHRIYALIGKNGAGKTTILASLAKDLAKNNATSFSPLKPSYAKIISVSYSFFDNFEIPKSDLSFNYAYCGLKKRANDFKTRAELKETFYKSVTIIKEGAPVKDKTREYLWYNVLSQFLPNKILHVAFDKNTNEFNIEKTEAMLKYLSSGQSILIFLFTEIMANIRYDSLILFDEPETHLHPNAVSSVVDALFYIVKMFESFCIIGTHSPLIIQEIPARNIFVIEREAQTNTNKDEDLAYVRKLDRESFGENLTVITQDIFGNKTAPKHFIKLIERLLQLGKSYSEIISIIKTKDLPITSNISLYIKALSEQSKI